jgi:hypothetical protein
LNNFIELETWIKNDENDKEVLSVPKWMSQAFNNIDIASDLSEFEKEFKMQQSIKQYRPKHYFEFFKIIFNSPLYNSGICKLHNSTFEISSIELWNGVSDFHWHWDGPGNDDIYALVYWTDNTSLSFSSFFIQVSNSIKLFNLSKCCFFKKTLDMPLL